MAVRYARTTIHFNLDDPYEAELYRHLRRQRVKSTYIKRLVDYDRHGLVGNKKLNILGGGIHGEQNQGIEG